MVCHGKISVAWALNRNSLKTRVLRKNAEVVITGCLCHILHNAVGKASEAFAAVPKFDLENHCVNVFHWFKKSTKRKSILKDITIFVK